MIRKLINKFTKRFFNPYINHCDKCGHIADNFTVPDEVWSRFADNVEAIYCVHCFTEMCHNNRFFPQWVMSQPTLDLFGNRFLGSGIYVVDILPSIPEDPATLDAVIKLVECAHKIITEGRAPEYAKLRDESEG